MPGAPTVLFFHAHPDDESLFTAGVSNLLAQSRVSSILITCTDGRWGFDQSGRPGNVDGHDDAETARVRAAELARAANWCAISDHRRWEFFDSGMTGWPQAEHPNAFVNQSVDELADRLARMCDENEVRAVVTYDEGGFYGHPDHIMANRVALAAASRSTAVQRVWYPVVAQSRFADFVPRARARGVQLPAWITDGSAGTPDDLITCRPHTAAFADRKRAAIAAHASQIDNADLLTMGEELFDLLFAAETYQLGWASSPDDAGHPTDLLGGLS